MQQKLITFAVPCYNSAAYMRHCVETLLSAGEQAEIILVDDGSVKDDTPAICDEYAAKYPTIVKAIHQENGGHGEGVNQGIRNATGLYYKVVDSDDWLDIDALKKVLAKLTTLVARGTAPDMMICNYVYEHVEDNTTLTACYWKNNHEQGIGYNKEGIAPEATNVDGTNVTWENAVDAMNTALQKAGSEWRYELKGALPTLRKQ